MAFELRVTFTGLCLYLAHPDGTKAAVLLPDARKTTAEPLHADGTRGEFHAGYLRFDLAHLDARFPAAGEDEVPAYEAVHRLNRQVIDFGLGGAAAPQDVQLALPDFGAFAPALRPLPGLFSATPPDALLSRLVLDGGTITGLPEDAWTLPATLNPTGQPYDGQFASLITWTRQVEGDGLTLTLSGFDGGGAVRIPLTPVDTEGGRVIALKVANLCDKNVLEWPELGVRTVDQDDVDFKWLYRLLTPPEGSYGDLLNGSAYPIPHLQPTQSFGVEDCMGGKIEVVFP
jgi:hypothetical protein